MAQQQVALITGGTDGIGKSAAKKLVMEGWSVTIVGRNPQRCAAAVAEIKQAAPQGEISAIIADLSLLSDTKQACQTFLASHTRLDVLMLNANAISQERQVTAEGFEMNFAVGHLSRALMTLLLEPALKATPNAQILNVVGRSWERLDYANVMLEQDFSAWKALTRWQWTSIMFTTRFGQGGAVLTNTYMPDLVKTKILADEPGLMRYVIKVAMLVMGISVEKSADNIAAVLSDVVQKRSNGAFYEWKTRKPMPKMDVNTDDLLKVSDLTRELLKSYL